MGKVLVYNFVQFSFKDKTEKYIRHKRDLKWRAINRKIYEILII